MIIHRETSIKENSKENLNETINSLGKQLAREKLESIKKDKIISELGKHEAKLSMDLMQMKNEVNAIKQALDKKGGE